MNNDQAKQLIHNTFDYPFEEHKFTNFIDDLLIDVDFNESFGYIPPSQNQFKTHVKEYSKIGQYTDPDGDVIDILSAKLNNSFSLEKSRTTLRNFVAEYLKNSIESDGCLIAFNVDGYEDWRFSYIKLQYDLEADSETGKTKAVQKLTPAKRYSFLVGKNEPNHTAQAQILPLLAKPEKPTLKDIEESFSVDKVTKQFYEDYRKLFEDLSKELNRIVESDSVIKSDFDKHSIEVDNFSKKLLGQIVFLYFLQKKGWLGIKRNSDGKYGDWGSGKKDFMRRLYNKEYCEYDNFFNDVLEHLFYNGLGSENSGDVYSKLNSKIPFLNGGLFSPINDYNWQETDIVIENKFIENILDTFDKYNFTVREDNPLDKEVAIDPEMLGRVFENLLPENIRKGKGAFYTPRTIVHYMCQESLINYLGTECENIDVDKIRDLISNNSKEYTLSDSELEKIDSKLHDVKICDPAIGSGAFPVGMMNEIIKTRVYANEKLNKEYTIYDLKRHCISESIYGVDLDPGAIEIAKLRLWLSLIVDEDDYHNIQSLPNLDFKIMQGNSLIEDFHGISLDIEKKEGEQTGIFEGGQELDRLIDKLHDKQLAFLESNHPSKKKKLKEEVEQSIYNIFDSEIKKVTGLSKEEKQKKSNELLEMTHGNKIRNFFPWKLYFADIFRENGGFDILIANPPYLKERGNADIFESVNKSSLGTMYHQGKMDYWYYFLHQAINVKNLSSTISFITSRYWIQSSGATKLIESIKKNLKFYSILDVGKIKVFDNVVGQHLVYTFSSKVVKKTLYKKVENNLNDISSMISTSNVSVSHIDTQKIIKNKSIRFELMDVDIGKKPNICILGDIIDCSQGVVEATDKVSKKAYNMNPISSIHIGDGVFVLNDEEIETKGLNPGKNKILKPYLDPKDVNRYQNAKPRKFLIYSDKFTKLDIQNNKYPEIKNHLDKYKNFITSSNKPYGIHRARERRFFENSKLICSGMFSKPAFTFDNSGAYVGFSFTVMIQKDCNFNLKYILAILNSKLGHYWFIYNAKKRGVGYDVGVQKFREFPIVNIENDRQNELVNFVDKIMNEKNNNPIANTEALEEKINQLVYKLYDLTEEEIQIVESSVD